MAPARFRKGVARGPQHGDEDLGPAHLSGCPVDHLHGVTGEVDEHPLARGVNLAQRRLQPADPFAIQIAEPGVAEPVLALSPPRYSSHSSDSVTFGRRRSRCTTAQSGTGR